MAEEKGLKELKEVLVGLEKVALLAKAALKDGKIDLGDLSLLAGLLSSQAELSAAIAGFDEAVLEAKDLSADEAMELAGLLLAALKRVKAA